MSHPAASANVRLLVHRACAISLAFACLDGCHRPSPTLDTADAGAVVKASSSPSASAAASATAPVTAHRSDMKSKGPVGANVAAKTGEDVAAKLEAGRAAIRAKRYDEAISILGGACENGSECANPGRRALGEIGYAQLLAGRPEEARATLLRVWNQSFDYRLRAQAAYNLGLAHDALHREAEALPWYFNAQLLRPSPAAERKLTGKTFCPVEIDTAVVPATVHDGWYEVFYAFGLDKKEEAKFVPLSESAARSYFCRHDECSNIDIVVSPHGDFDEDRRAARTLTGGKILVSSSHCNALKIVGSEHYIEGQGDLDRSEAGGWLHFACAWAATSAMGRGTEQGEECMQDGKQPCVTSGFQKDLVQSDSFYDAASLVHVATITQRTPCGAACAGTLETKSLIPAIEGGAVVFKPRREAPEQGVRSAVTVTLKGDQIVLSAPPYCEKTIPIVHPPPR